MSVDPEPQKALRTNSPGFENASISGFKTLTRFGASMLPEKVQSITRDSGDEVAGFSTIAARGRTTPRSEFLAHELAQERPRGGMGACGFLWSCAGGKAPGNR
jgi:hypothetical protein